MAEHPTPEGILQLGPKEDRDGSKPQEPTPMSGTAELRCSSTETTHSHRSRWDGGMSAVLGSSLRRPQ